LGFRVGVCVGVLGSVCPRLAQECFKKSPLAEGFKGRASEEHRVFIVSADLLSQDGVDEPWATFAPPEEKVFEACLKFLTSVRGPSDVSLAFDGSNRKTRRAIEDNITAMPCSAELTVVFNSSWNSWFKRGCFLSSANTEIGYVSLPVSRARFQVKARDSGKFAGAGEESNHYCSYTGVALDPRTLLARITPDEKNKVFKEPTKPVPKKWSDAITTGVPMFWQETKPASLWTQVLGDLKAKVVVDLSPGSGVLASACLELGIPYFGMCQNAMHMQWLTNVIDRFSLRLTVKSGSFLYREDLAMHISELFAHLLPTDETEEDADGQIQRSDDEGECDGPS
jgi:hypothetical protein